jgi:PBSX family phage terminase large subunit
MSAVELLPPKLRDLFFRPGLNGGAEYIPSRYKVAHGGRGSGKSHGFARTAVALATVRKVRVLCAREVQSSIRESIYRLLSDIIYALGLAAYFDIQRETIYGPHGSEFIFAGIKSDPGKIKSAEGIDICLVEEAHNVTDESWSILIPTIRKPGSEIWVCFNPTLDKQPTYKRFIVETPPQCRRVEINWRDNPWFPSVLELERQYALKRIADANDDAGKAALRALYDHVWEGKTLKYATGAFFSEGSLLVEGLPVDTPTSVDSVYAVIDTAMKSGKEHDGLSVTYFALDTKKRTAHPLYVLDWDLKQIDAALLEAWLPTVFATLEALAKETHAIYGSIGAFIEDKVSGTVLIQQGQNRGWPVIAIDSKLTALGTSERCIAAGPYVHAGDVKYTRRAYERVVTYHGESRNHSLGQVLDFSASVKDMGEDDAVNTFAYGVVIGLGNPDGF